MAFEGRYRETQRGGGFGSGSASTVPSENGAATALQELDQELVKFQGCIDSVGTQFDNHDNRTEMKRLRSVIKSKVTATKSGLKESKKSQDKIVSDRMTTQLEAQISRFQSLLEKEKAVVKKHPTAKGTSSPPESGSRENIVVSPAQSQAMSQVQRMEGLEEREEEREELHQLEADILDLRDIQQEMAQLVGDQGEDINNIEKNVSRAAVRVESGTKQTTVAVQLKRKNMRLKFVIGAIVVAVIVAVLVVLAILLGVFIPRVTGSGGSDDNN